jgi:rRNA maturation endonuclease Nob1
MVKKQVDISEQKATNWKRCPHYCYIDHDGTATFCPQCGNLLVPMGACPTCSTIIPNPNWRYCAKCGTRL